MRLGLGGPLVVDPPYASPASPSDLMVARPPARRADRGRWRAGPWPRAARLARSLDRGRGPAGVAVRPRSRGHLRQRPPRDGRRRRGLARARDRGGRRLAGGPAARVGRAGSGPYLDGDGADGQRAAGRGRPHRRDRARRAAWRQLPWLLAAPAYGVVDVRAMLAIGAPRPRASTATRPRPQRAVADRRRRRRPACSWSAGAGTVAHLDGIELRPYADGAAAYDAFVDGDVDWAPVPGRPLRRGRRRARGRRLRAVPGRAAPRPANLTDPVLARPQLRQAIAAAIDRRAIVDAVYPDVADPLDAVVPAGVAGADPRPLRRPARTTRPRPGGCSRAAFPDGRRARRSCSTTRRRRPRTRRWRSWPGDLEAVGHPAPSTGPRSLEDHQRLRRPRRPAALHASAWLGGYGRRTPTSTRCSGRRRPTTLVGLADDGHRRGAGRRPVHARRRRSRRGLAGRARPTVLARRRSSSRSPSSASQVGGRRRRPRPAPRRRRHRRLVRRAARRLTLAAASGRLVGCTVPSG